MDLPSAVELLGVAPSSTHHVISGQNDRTGQGRLGKWFVSVMSRVNATAQNSCLRGGLASGHEHHRPAEPVDI
jgi:hypothetical protein